MPNRTGRRGHTGVSAAAQLSRARSPGERRRFLEGEADAFLYAKPAGIPGAVARMAWWSLRDAVACLRTGTWSDLPRIPARQLVYHWGWLRGHRHGTARRRRGNRDISLGQRTVLSRHESVQAR